MKWILDASGNPVTATVPTTVKTVVVTDASGSTVTGKIWPCFYLNLHLGYTSFIKKNIGFKSKKSL